MSANDRTVSRLPDGTWQNFRNNGDITFHGTQNEAAVAAAEMLYLAGGGVMTIKRVDGSVRSSHLIGDPDFSAETQTGLRCI